MTQRRLDVDVVRFLALFAMFVAHVAPTAGPGGILTLSEFVTMPLFSLLVGVGAQLGVWHAESTGRWGRWWRSVAVRAVLLIGVGLALEEAGANVLIVLVHLGVLVVVVDLLARAPWWAVAAGGAVAFAVTTPLMERFAQDTFETSNAVLMQGRPWEPGTWWDVQLFLWGYEPYRLGSMIVYGCVGVLLARWWLARESVPRWHMLAGGGAALAVAAVAMAARVTGRVELHPYSGTYVETLFNVALITAVMGVGLWVTPLLPGMLARLLAAAGAMSLTIYALHVIWLAVYVQVLRPGVSDDSWHNLVILTLGTLVIAGLWSVVVRRGPMKRGPLEGVAALLTR